MSLAASVFAAPGAPTGWAAVGVSALMLLAWAASVRLRDVSIVDPLWGPAFVLVALVVALTADGCVGRRWLLFAMTALWGLRLGAHLARRKRSDRGEDRRYAAMRARRGKSFVAWSLVGIFGVQGLLVLVVSLPVQVAAPLGGRLTVAVVPGVLVWMIGLFFETVGDEQLRRFKADPESRGKVMDRGLWRYTRHPNYFGDFCVWWGLWLTALPAGGTWWTFIGPVVMSALLLRVSGAALLEKDISERRPDYRDYIARTSAFVPLPPKREEDGQGSSR
jgi:steroid 5-alpha reductase family enzyme